MFKEGQRVWCSFYGWGVVDQIDTIDNTVGVDFEEVGIYHWFAADGSTCDGIARALFFEKVIPQPSALVPPIEYLELKRGDVVLYEDRGLLYVAEDSHATTITFKGMNQVPVKLEDAYTAFMCTKEKITKKIGNILD